VRDGICIHLITRARFDSLEKEPTPEMLRVPLEEVVLSVCDLGLDQAEDDDCFADGCSVARNNHGNDSNGDATWDGGQGETMGVSCSTDGNSWGVGAWEGAWCFLRGAPDPPMERSVRTAHWELQHIGALDDLGYITHLGALLARLPLPPGLGAALFLGGLLGVPQAASSIAAVLEGREPWCKRKGRGVGGCRSHNRHSSEEEGGDDGGGGDSAAALAAASFANGIDGEAIFSDAFSAARALREFEAMSGECAQGGVAFCAERGLIHPVMQQMTSARHQLVRALKEKGCESDSTGLDKNLETSWPLQQAVITFAFDSHVGELVGGRRVQAGWSKAARLARTSVLCGSGSDTVGSEDPPSPLIVYADYASGSSGRILRIGSMVTPHQLLLYGGRNGPSWKHGRVVIEGWLNVAAEFETAVLLGALRSVTRAVLQYAAKLSHEAARGQAPCHDADPWLQEWRACVREIAEQPLPGRTRDPWNMLGVPSWDTSPRPVGASSLGGSTAAAVTSEHPAVLDLPLGWTKHTDADWKVFFHCASSGLSQWEHPSMELPLGWSSQVDPEGKAFYHCACKGESRWKRPDRYGPDQHAAVWRWELRDGQRRYLRVDASHSQLHPPRVGDGQVLPFGWDAIWDSARQMHYYWNRRTDCTAWDFPLSADVTA